MNGLQNSLVSTRYTFSALGIGIWTQNYILTLTSIYTKYIIYSYTYITRPDRVLTIAISDTTKTTALSAACQLDALDTLPARLYPETPDLLRSPYSTCFQVMDSSYSTYSLPTRLSRAARIARRQVRLRLVCVCVFFVSSFHETYLARFLCGFIFFLVALRKWVEHR